MLQDAHEGGSEWLWKRGVRWHPMVGEPLKKDSPDLWQVKVAQHHEVVRMVQLNEVEADSVCSLSRGTFLVVLEV